STKSLVLAGGELLDTYRRLVNHRDMSNYEERQACLMKVRSMVTACFILIAAFTGRRLSEILTIKRGWLAGSNHNWQMRTRILKKKVKQEAWTVIPTLVANAFKWIKDLGSIGTEFGDNDPLFSFFDIHLNEIVRLRPQITLPRY